MKNRVQKKAVITGGGRGIGKAIAKAFLVQGAEVLLISRGKTELEASAKELSSLGKAGIFRADVSSESDVESAAEAVKRLWGKLDVLVNAAAITGPIGPLVEVSPAEWKKNIEINLIGTFLMIRAMAPLMRGRGSKIINFVGGGEASYPNFSAYVASKGGITRLTETLAEELVPKGIDVNAIAPGPVNTKMLDDLIAAGPERAGRENYELGLEQKSRGGVPPERVAELAVFLASSASDGLSGKIISAVWDNYASFSKHFKEIMSSDIYNYRRIKPKDRGFNW